MSSAGATSAAAAAFAAMSPSVPTTTRASGSVARDTTAAGVLGARPTDTSARQVSSIPREAHVEHERAARRNRRGDVGVAAGCVRRDERDARRALAVRQRDVRDRGRSEGRRDAGDDLERDPRRRELFGLFASSPEDERVAALEPDHVFAFEGALDDRRVDAGLVMPAPLGPPPDRDALGPRRRDGQHLGRHELVVRHHLRGGQEPVGPDGEKLGIPGPRAHEPDLAAADGPDSVSHRGPARDTKQELSCFFDAPASRDGAIHS